MLRSMMIGLAIAGLLHVATGLVAPAGGIAVASKRIDWMAVQADSLASILCKGSALIAR